MKEVYLHFNVPSLSPVEERFIAEYVRILSPLSEAFDFLQAEKDPRLGFLLPTLVVLKGRLTSATMTKKTMTEIKQVFFFYNN